MSLSKVKKTVKPLSGIKPKILKSVISTTFTTETGSPAAVFIDKLKIKPLGPYSKSLKMKRKKLILLYVVMLMQFL